jgi:hypothetical protein
MKIGSHDMLLWDSLQFKKPRVMPCFATPMFARKFGLIHCIIAFVKDEGNNLGSMAMTLKSIVDYEPLKML